MARVIHRADTYRLRLMGNVIKPKFMRKIPPKTLLRKATIQY